MSGSSPEDAVEALKFDVVDTLELYIEEEENLIPQLKQYVNVLRKYIEFS